MQNVSNEMILILAGVTVAVLLQAGVLLGIFLTMRTAVQTAKDEAEEYRAKLTPLLENGGQLIKVGNELLTSAATLFGDVKPELEAAVTELANMTRDAHAQVNQLQALVDEVAQKARNQAERVDGMTTSFLNGLDHFGTFLNEAVRTPIRQVNGVIAAFKAVVDTLRSPAPPRRRPTRVDEDKDLFE